MGLASHSTSTRIRRRLVGREKLPNPVDSRALLIIYVTACNPLGSYPYIGLYSVKVRLDESYVFMPRVYNWSCFWRHVASSAESSLYNCWLFSHLRRQKHTTIQLRQFTVKFLCKNTPYVHWRRFGVDLFWLQGSVQFLISDQYHTAVYIIAFTSRITVNKTAQYRKLKVYEVAILSMTSITLCQPNNWCVNSIHLWTTLLIKPRKRLSPRDYVGPTDNTTLPILKDGRSDTRLPSIRNSLYCGDMIKVFKIP